MTLFFGCSSGRIRASGLRPAQRETSGEVSVRSVSRRKTGQRETEEERDEKGMNMRGERKTGQDRRERETARETEIKV